MTADGAPGILTVSQHAEFTRTQPEGNNLNHFQSELRACSILLLGRLPGLFLFRLSIAAGSQFRVLPFAIEADEDRECPCLLGRERKRDLQGENDPAMAEGKDGPFLGRTERVVVHAGAPDMASRLARQSVIDSAGEDFGTERQQELEDAVAEVIEVPAGWLKKR
jgi:hypothetical protein